MTVTEIAAHRDFLRNTCRLAGTPRMEYQLGKLPGQGLLEIRVKLAATPLLVRTPRTIRRQRPVQLQHAKSTADHAPHTYSFRRARHTCDALRSGLYVRREDQGLARGVSAPGQNRTQELSRATYSPLASADMKPHRSSFDPAYVRCRARFAAFESRCFKALCEFVRADLDNLLDRYYSEGHESMDDFPAWTFERYLRAEWTAARGDVRRSTAARTFFSNKRSDRRGTLRRVPGGTQRRCEYYR